MHLPSPAQDEGGGGADLPHFRSHSLAFALTPSPQGTHGTHALRGRGFRLRYADGGTGDTRFTRSVCSLRLGVDLSESVLWVCGESDLNRTCMPLHDIRYTIYTDTDTGYIRFRGSAEEEEETNALKIHFSMDRPRRTRIQFVLLDSNVRILRKAEKGSEAGTSLSLSLSLVKGNNGILAVDCRRCALLSLFCFIHVYLFELRWLN